MKCYRYVSWMCGSNVKEFLTFRLLFGNCFHANSYYPVLEYYDGPLPVQFRTYLINNKIIFSKQHKCCFILARHKNAIFSTVSTLKISNDVISTNSDCGEISVVILLRITPSLIIETARSHSRRLTAKTQSGADKRQ